MLIRQRNFDEAGRWVARLEELERRRNAYPGSFGGVELKAKLYEAMGRGDDAVDLLKKYAERLNNRGDKPEAALFVVYSYARQKRHAKALAHAEELAKKVPPEVIGGVLVTLLREMKPTEEQCGRVEALLKAGLERAEKLDAAKGGTAARANLRLYLADLHDLRGRYDEAEALYRGGPGAAGKRGHEQPGVPAGAADGQRPGGVAGARQRGDRRRGASAT